MPLRDAEFYISQDLLSILALSSGRRRCVACSQCEKCQFSLAYNSWEHERQTQIIDKNIVFNQEDARFEINYCFHEPHVHNGTSITDFQSQRRMAETHYYSMERRLLNRFDPMVVQTTNETMQEKFKTGQFMTEEQMLKKDPKSKDYQKVYHPWTIALQPERKLTV